MKKIITFILAALLCFSLSGPVFADSFSDIEDPASLIEAEALRTLGIINGVGDNLFAPNATLSRAAFCKMAILSQDRGNEAQTYINRTIFPDVTSSHWARGYINLAATGTSVLLRGFADGTFRPDEDITYAQAVTILMRILGYSDTDAGMLWPKGYLDLADKSGLTNGLSISANSPITRQQAVHLFYNLLFTEQKNGSRFLGTLGSASDDMILTHVEGERLWISGKEYKSLSSVSECLIGLRGTILTDSRGNVTGFFPDMDDAPLETSISEAQAGYIIDSNGAKHSVSGDVTVYHGRDSEKFSSAWLGMTKGSSIKLFFDSAGNVNAIYFALSRSDNAMAAKNEVSGNPFTALTGSDKDYQIYKNGAAASVSDIRQYDTAVYDSHAKILYVSDNRVTGCYENASPSFQYPETITLLGTTFTVLDCARDDLASFKYGDNITLLLTDDNRIAGAVPAASLMVKAVGILESWNSEEATVNLFNGLKVSGKPYGALTNQVGSYVSAHAYKSGNEIHLYVTALPGFTASADLDVVNRSVGNDELSTAVRVFEKVGSSAISSIAYSDIPVQSLPASSIKYLHKNHSGKIDIMVLENVTGNCFSYGFLTAGTLIESDYFGTLIQNSTITVTNSDGSSDPLIYSYQFPDGAAGGVVSSADGKKAAGIVLLTEVSGISRTAFKTDSSGVSVTVNGSRFSVAKDVHCYNSITGSWFSSLDEARAFSDELTVYYDTSAEKGGQIRLICAG